MVSRYKSTISGIIRMSKEKERDFFDDAGQNAIKR